MELGDTTTETQLWGRLATAVGQARMLSFVFSTTSDVGSSSWRVMNPIKFRKTRGTVKKHGTKATVPRHCLGRV